jgi:hypothetical protein
VLLAVASAMAVMVVAAVPAMADVKISSSGLGSISHKSGFASDISNFSFNNNRNTILFNSFDSVFNDVGLSGFESIAGATFSMVLTSLLVEGFGPIV